MRWLLLHLRRPTAMATSSSRGKGTRVVPVAIRQGIRKNYDTLVDAKVGRILIRNISIIDDHDGQANAFLPDNVEITDEILQDRVINAALSKHYGVFDKMKKGARRRRK